MVVDDGGAGGVRGVQCDCAPRCGFLEGVCGEAAAVEGEFVDAAVGRCVA